MAGFNFTNCVFYLFSDALKRITTALALTLFAPIAFFKKPGRWTTGSPLRSFVNRTPSQKKRICRKEAHGKENRERGCYFRPDLRMAYSVGVDPVQLWKISGHAESYPVGG